MSFEEALCNLDQFISLQNDYLCSFALQSYQAISHHDGAEERLELFSGRESQDVYCWLEKV